MSSPTHRRRAACAALAPVLGEAALPEALQLLPAGSREDGIASVIAFIDAVAARHLLDAPTRKRLYLAYHEALQRPESALPPAPEPATPAALPVLRAPTPPTAVAAAMPAAPLSLPPPVSPQPSRPPEPPAPDIPAEQQVFAALMRSALQALRQTRPGALDEVRESLTASLPRLRGSPRLREQLRSAWSQVELGDWRLDASAAHLAEAVDLFYIALCEALGPVEADRVLTEAVREADRIEAARRFSPRRLV